MKDFIFSIIKMIIVIFIIFLIPFMFPIILKIFLNIIEPSEDDKKIKLTKYGKQFVEYIEKKEVV